MGARTAAPGGGSVSALLAALGAGLGSMVINIFFQTRLYAGGNHDKKMSSYLDEIELEEQGLHIIHNQPPLKLRLGS